MLKSNCLQRVWLERKGEGKSIPFHFMYFYAFIYEFIDALF